MEKHETYFAFLDILGFTEFEKNYDFYIEHYCKYLDTIKNICKVIECDPNLKILNSKLSIKISSDSIILFTHENKLESLAKLIYSTYLFLFNSLYKSLPLRGTIYNGDLFICKKSIELLEIDTIIGKDLLKAMKLEKSQEWSGCVIHNNCITSKNDINELKKIFKAINLNYNDYLLEYDVPFKKGKKKCYVVNWIQKEFEYQIRNDDIIQKSFKNLNKFLFNHDIIDKLDNTIEFTNYVLNK